MSFIIKKEQGKTQKPVPVGMYQAVLYSIIDLGTHQADPKFKPSRKVAFTFELTDHFIEIDDNGESVKKRKAISKEVPMKLSDYKDGSNLFKLLKSWVGLKSVPDEGYDLSQLLGNNAFLNIVHTPGAKDPSKTYSIIDSVNPLPNGIPILEPENNIFCFFIEETPQRIPETIPEWARNKIMKSEEYQQHGVAAVNLDDDGNAPY